MNCTGCAARRAEIGKAAKAVRAGRHETAVRHLADATRSLGDDAKAFAAALKARLARR